MNVRKYTIALTTDASGDCIAYSEGIRGRLLNVIYTKPGTNPLADTADFTITNNTTGQPILSKTDVSASFNLAPRQALHDAAGAAAVYAAAGSPVLEHFYLANEQVKVVVAQGGNAKLGTITLIVG